MIKNIIIFMLIISYVATAVDNNDYVCFPKNISNNTASNDGSCNVSISLTTEKSRYNNSEKITFYNNLTDKTYPFVIQYWIEDSEGSIIKNKINTTNLNAKSFTPNFNKPKALVLRNELVSVDCNNTSNDLSSEKIVRVNVEVDNNPKVEIISLYLGSDNKAKLGNKLIPKILVYTGNFSSEVLTVYIINITPQLMFDLNESFISYEFKPELAIPNDCSIVSNNYTLIASALGIYSSGSLFIENDCKNNTINNSLSNSSVMSLSGNKDYDKELVPESNINLLESPSSEQTIYSSANIRAKKPMLYAFIAVALFMLFAIMPKGKLLRDLTKNGIHYKGNNRSDRPS